MVPWNFCCCTLPSNKIPKQMIQEGETKTCAENLFLVLFIRHHFLQMQVRLLCLEVNLVAVIVLVQPCILPETLLPHLPVSQIEFFLFNDCSFLFFFFLLFRQRRTVCVGEESQRVPGNRKNGRPVFPMEGKDGGIKVKSIVFG